MISVKEMESLVTYYGTMGYRGREESRTPARVQTRRETQEENKKQPQKLLLTWLVNEPKLFHKLDGIITPDDFLEPMYHSVAIMLYDQYEEDGYVTPARILNQFVDSEEQKQVAGMFNARLELAPSKEDNDKVITDIVKKVKNTSLDYKMGHENDIFEYQKLINEKADIMKLHISL
jgi:DNA primase